MYRQISTLTSNFSFLFPHKLGFSSLPLQPPQEISPTRFQCKADLFTLGEVDVATQPHANDYARWLQLPIYTTASDTNIGNPRHPTQLKQRGRSQIQRLEEVRHNRTAKQRGKEVVVSRVYEGKAIQKCEISDVFSDESEIHLLSDKQ